MKAKVSWVGERSFVGRAESGHSLVFGTAHGEDGAKPGPSPMELVLIGTGGCSAWDVVNILAKGRQAVEDVVVELDADRAEAEPRVFTRIHLHFVVRGRGVDPLKVERAIELSVTKYCSASAMLEKTATITHDFEVVETGCGGGRRTAGSPVRWIVGGFLHRRLEPGLVGVAELRPVDVDRQLVELRGQREGRLVVGVVHAGERVRADVEGLVPLQDQRQRPLHRLAVDVLAVDPERAGAGPPMPLKSLKARVPTPIPSYVEVELDGVLAGRQRARRPPT